MRATGSAILQKNEAQENTFDPELSRTIVPDGEHESYYDFPPLRSRRRGDTVYEIERSLREAIVELRLPPGHYIDKKLICERLGVSRFPVSEALAKLCSEGLVEVLPQRGTRVAKVRISDVREAFLIWCAVEPAVVEQNIQCVSDRTLSILARILNDQAEAVSTGNMNDFYRADDHFHETIVASVSRGFAVSTLQSVRSSALRAIRLLSDSHRHERSIAEHRMILDALVRRDGHAAAVAIVSHILACQDEFVVQAAQRESIFVMDDGLPERMTI